MTNIHIFSGFLGAGKTTLIKKLLGEAYAGERVVLIENEFGQIGIDSGFLKECGVQITEMNQGCICCSLVGDFAKALEQVLRDFAPDRILIEPSGVGKLSDVIRAVSGVLSDEVVLASAATVVDAGKCRLYIKNFGEFFGDQIEHADSIVLSHTDRLPEDKLAACVALLREHNDHATIVTTSWDALHGSQLSAAMEGHNTLADELTRLQEEHEHEHHHHHHDHECDDPECECHHHHDEDEHEHKHHEHHHHHGHECDDPECECHHHHDEHDHHEHHHHHDHECDDPECECHHHHHHHADEVFESIGAETTKKFTMDEIKEKLEALNDEEKYGKILRAKGIVACECGKFIYFDFVPGEADVRAGEPDVIGKLCVIGSNINKDAVSELFGVKLKA
jgi:G3E family GTPase